MSIFGTSEKKSPAGGFSLMAALFGKRKACPEEPAEKNFHRFTGSVVSDVGCVRSNNEDNYVLGPYMNHVSSDHSEASFSGSESTGMWNFAGVFDGMGGGEMGELAARDTAAIFLNAFSQLSSVSDKAEVDRCIRKAFLEANNRIIDLQKEYKIFGTTGTVLCANEQDFKIYHLGDSRAYLVRENKLKQLTRDQTLAQMKMEVGMYREDDPAAEADKHKLTEYIGRDWTKANIKPVESHWIPAQTHDCVLLCSDGLYDMCTDEEIVPILLDEKPVSEKASALVNSAISRGGEDNITCVVVLFT